MSLRFILGASGAGKSTALHKMITERAGKERDRNFLFIVPDQFTMQTQIDLVKASPDGGIMNIDVLSFGRLAHRIFEETGADRRMVLDDTGKNLILRSLASDLASGLPVLGRNLNRPGYIHEIKSVISEFKQYDISSEKLEEMIGFCEGRRMLQAKLRDLRIINDAFNKYTKDRYITTEETMTLLTEVLDRSKIIPHAVVVFDGFTGFTPVQYRLIRRLLELTDEVNVSVTIDIDADPYQMKGEQELFCLSRKTIRNLQLCAAETNTRLDGDILLSDKPRFAGSPVLAHLERSAFRYPIRPFEGGADGISITASPDIETEVRECLTRIRDLVMDRGYAYRDIAVVCGDLPAYTDTFRLLSPAYGIPVFPDETAALRLNPFTEYLRSALLVIRDRFSYDSVFHFLRSGFSALSMEKIDRLENYVLACGIRGEKRYREEFTGTAGLRKEGEPAEEGSAALEELNNSRDELWRSLRPLLGKKKTAKDYAEALKEFIATNGLEDRLFEFSERFRERGERELFREYSQIFALVEDLLDKMSALLGDEETDIDEFIRLFDSGLDEIDVGTLPGGIDRVIVGDMERSRISEVKILFLLGASDGNIPRAGRGGGLISDADREFLKDRVELSPTPHEQIYTQRFYLYMNMTKPSEELHISFSRTDSSGKALKESYLIPMMKKLFLSLSCKEASTVASPFETVSGVRDGVKVLSDALRTGAEDAKGILTRPEMRALFRVLSEDPEGRSAALSVLGAAAFFYKPDALPAKISEDLYGKVLRGSVSRIETLSACAYAHFLAYGIGLKERDEYEFRPVDFGNICHEVLQRYNLRLREKGYDLSNCPEEEGDRILREELEEICAGYGEHILHSSSRNEYMIERIHTILKRTVDVFRHQLLKGTFSPWEAEYPFSEEMDLGDGAKMLLRGRVDRIDLCENNDRSFIKILDYKSGNKTLEEDALYYGLQLQMPLYMAYILKLFRERYPEKHADMGAMLYYHLEDPVISDSSMPDPEKAEKMTVRSLRPNGLVSGEADCVFSLDRTLKEPSVDSDVIPVGTRADGSYKSRSGIVMPEEYRAIENYVTEYVKKSGKRILNGDIAVDPKDHRGSDSCKWCSFRDICGFDEKLSGYRMNELPALEREEAMRRIREGL
ncbi:MAG: PD-(D/E)XK nuclease family protein [Lachnospiraceae bacterium]|nr:PD-(D/E)XK nuclease family protein [Lachnospiraceae bacterium]